jgi:hypothetical protein
LTDDPKETARKERAERAFKSKEEGAQATSEYEAAGRVVREKTIRLRALRLAKEAKEKTDADANKKTVINPTKVATRRGRPSFKKGIAKAVEMAGQEIDRLGDASATHEQRASRKRRLIKGPKEFREIREDQPKRKR